MDEKKVGFPDYDPSWIPEPNPDGYNTTPEYESMGVLNNLLLKLKVSIQIQRNEDVYKIDLIVYQFDFNTLKRGEKICGIEVEQKSISFPEDAKCWPYPEESFLYRKTIKKDVDKKDVYLLVDKNVSTKICFWETFEFINERFGFHLLKRIPDDIREWYWRRPTGESNIGIRQGWNAIVEYIIQLNEEKND